MKPATWVAIAGGLGLGAYGLIVVLLLRRREFSEPQVMYLMAPLTVLLPLSYYDTLTNWREASSSQKIKAGGSLVVASILFVGVVIWGLLDIVGAA